MLRHDGGLGKTSAGVAARAVSSGGRSVTAADVERLRHIRDITPNAGGARLLLFSAGSSKPASAGHIEVVDLERLYTGG